MKINRFLKILILFAPLSYADLSTVGGLRVASESLNHFLIVFLRSSEGVILGHLYHLTGVHLAELYWIDMAGNVIQTMFYEGLPNIRFQLVEELPPNAFNFIDST